MEARGAVSIPKGTSVFLDASQELCNDLSVSRSIPPQLLTNGIGFSEKDLTTSKFHELAHLHLNCIIINSCGTIRVQQLHHLAKLGTVEHLNLTLSDGTTLGGYFKPST